ncbi:MAG TPA: ethylbenzene dehydrogenase-related protein [Candidatus Dormibacteraeota bacterium]|nr:ethylbenzene dehydrogenase-related protein [Candidatus Dormibacteraeota bacterium]
MICTKIAGARDRLIDPRAAEWNGIPAEPLKMAATPLANQPSEYIKASRDETQIGKVRNLQVQAAHNGTDIFFRLSWEDASKDTAITDNDSFLDACGILMPLAGGDPPIDEMGSAEAPVNAWFWRADFGETARNTIAKGLGTTQFSTQSPIQAKAVWENNGWSVVFTRALSVPQQQAETVQLEAGKSVKIGFAVWEGSNRERAGVKSFSKEWRELTLEA